VGSTLLGWNLVADGSLMLFSISGGSGEYDASGLRESVQRAALFTNDWTVTQDIGGLNPFSQSSLLLRADGVRMSVSNPYAPFARAALSPDPHRVAISSGSNWEISIFAADGTLERVIAVDLPRIPVTSALVSAALQENLPGRLQAGLTARQVEEAWERLTIPDSIPAIGTLDFDETGYLWAGHRGTELASSFGISARYEVFDREGRWVTSVDAPRDLAQSGSRRLRILEIGDDYVLTQWRGELDVPYLRMYRIEKPSP
jgi:hypothetical protein